MVALILSHLLVVTHDFLISIVVFADNYNYEDVSLTYDDIIICLSGK